MRCVSVAHRAGSVSVEASINGADYSVDGAYFEYVELPRVDSVMPQAVLALAPSSVTVVGAGFVNAEQLRCRLSAGAAYRSAWHSATTIVCALPGHLAARNVTVEVSNDGMHFTQDGVRLWLSETPTVSSMRGTSGAVGGGELVTVIGSKLRSAGALSCRFGSAEAAASVISDSMMVCYTPASAAGARRVGFEVVAGSATLPVGDSALRSFEYVAEAEVESALPRSGPMSGGTLLSVIGRNFVRGAHECAIGSSGGRAAARYTSSTLLVCATPAVVGVTGAGAVDVYIRGAGAGSGMRGGSGSGRFVYTKAVELERASPSSGSVLGGEMVTIVGRHFLEDADVWCRFGERRTIANVLSSVKLRCTNPGGEVRNVSLEVSNNGADFEGRGLMFEIRAEGRMVTAVPSTGPAAGGTAVALIGARIPASASLVACVFGTDRVHAWAVNASAVMCLSPSQPSAGTSRIRLVHDGSGSSAVELGGSQGDWATFLYTEAVSVSAVWPSSGAARGGTLVQVTGGGFLVGSSGMRCRFGAGEANRSVAVEVVHSSTLLQCKVPRSASGEVTVEVSSNGGADFSGNGVLYRLLEDAWISELQPSSGPEVGGTRVRVLGAALRTMRGFFAGLVRQQRPAACGAHQPR
jgi:hypothetical protein